MRSQRAWFQTLVQGIAVADRWVLDGTPPTLAGLPWPTWFLRLAEGDLDPASEGVSSIPWLDLERQSLAAVLLAATPLMLPNINPYGHRQDWVLRGAAAWGLSASTLESLGLYFCYLGRGLPTDGLTVDGCSAVGPVQPVALDASALEPYFRLVQDSQGQFGLVLERSHRDGWNGAEIALAAVLTLAAGSAVPLALQQRYLGPEPLPGEGGDRWLSYSGDRLRQLGWQLYSRWAGLRVGAMTQGERPIMASDLGVE